MRIAFDPLNDRFNFLHDVDDDLFQKREETFLQSLEAASS